MAYHPAEKKLKKLLSLKKQIQDLEEEQTKERTIWKEAAAKVKSLGQEIGDKKKTLMESITT